jgi:hypothetical protein
LCIHPLIAGNLKENPSRILRFGLVVATAAITTTFSVFSWSEIAAIAACAPLVGAIFAIPKAIRDGVEQAL